MAMSDMSHLSRTEARHQAPTIPPARLKAALIMKIVHIDDRMQDSNSRDNLIHDVSCQQNWTKGEMEMLTMAP